MCGPAPYQENAFISQDSTGSSTVDIMCLPGHYYADGSNHRQLLCSENMEWQTEQFQLEHCAGMQCCKLT